MAAPYPKELRKRVVEDRLAGASIKAVAERFQVDESCVVRWVRRLREKGSVDPAPMGGAHRQRVVDEEGQQLLKEALDGAPDATLPELCGMYEELRGVKVTPQTMSVTVRQIGFTKKKGSSGGRQRTGRMS